MVGIGADGRCRASDCGSTGRWLNRVPLSAPPIVLVGLISYPLYLWHWPLLSLARIVQSGQPAFGVRLLVVAVSTGLAWLTWKLAEPPDSGAAVRVRGSPMLMRTCIAVTVATLVALGGLGEGGSSGLIRTAPRPATLSELANSASTIVGLKQCSGPSEPGKMWTWCSASGPGQPTIAVFGDSHAYYLFSGVAEAYRARGEGTLLIGATACPPVAGVGGFPATCVNANELALRFPTAAPSVKTVVLVSLGPYYLTGVPFGSVKGRLDSLDGVLDPVDIGRPEDREKNFERGFEITMSTLERAGKRVVLFIDVPELDFIPEACPGGRPVRISTSNLQSPCGVSREAVDRRQAIYRGILERLHQAHPSSRVLIHSRYMCGGGLCNANLQGQLLYGTRTT